MKSKIAMLLVMVMAIGLFQGVSFGRVVTVQEPKALGRLHELRVGNSNEGKPLGIRYNSEQLRLGMTQDIGVDEVSMGIYINDLNDSRRETISYYTSINGHTQKVDIHLEKNISSSMIDIQVVVNDKSGHITKFYTIDPAYIDVADRDDYKVPGDGSGTISYKNENANIQDRELVFITELDNEQEIVFKIYYDQVDRRLKISTTGIQEGYITPFSLNNAKQFESFKGFEVNPTHLVEGKTNALGVEFYSKDVINMTGEDFTVKEIPGSRPGIVISFAKPKVLINGAFETIDTASTTYTGILNLYNESGISKELSIDLTNTKKTSNASVASNDGKVIEKDDKYYIYISQNKKIDGEIHHEVFEFDALKSGIWIDAELKIKGGVFEQENLEDFRMKGKGGTYTKIDIRKMDPANLSIDIKPYDYNATKINYSLHKHKKIDVDYNGELEEKDKDDLIDKEAIYSLEDPVQEHIQLDNHESTITMNTQNGNIEGYVVQVTNEGKLDIYTQLIIYDPEQVPDPIHSIVFDAIDNTYCLVDEKTKKPIVAGTDLTFKIREYDQWKKKLQDGDIYYELYMGTEVDKRDDFEAIKVFKASLENNEPKIELYSGTNTDESNKPIESSSFEITLIENNLNEGVVTIKGMGLKYRQDKGWKNLVVPDKVQSYPMQSEIGVESFEGVTIPDVLYMYILPIFESEQQLSKGTESNMKSLTLDKTEEKLPVPNFLELSKQMINQTSAVIRFNRVNLENYIRKMIAPLELNVERTYEVFLSTVKDGIKIPVDTEESKANTVHAVVIPTGTTNHYQYQVDLGSEENLQKGIQDKLRKGETIKIKIKGDQENSNTALGTYIEGLDYNTPYYMQVRIKVNEIGEVSQNAFKDYSTVSSILTFTTGTNPIPPNPEDRRPPVPKNFEQYEDDKNKDNLAVLTWEKPLIKDEKNTEIYYEVVRTTESQLYLPDAVDIEDVAGNGKKLFKNDKNNSDYIQQSIDGIHWKEIEGQGAGEYNTDPFKGKYVIKDEKLLPNRVYYYYIRTVRVVKEGDGQVKSYSEWIMTPVTTSPIEPPENLQVETKYNSDTKHEVTVSFLVTIPEGVTVPSKSGFDFDFYIKGEDEAATEDAYVVYNTQIKGQGDGKQVKFVYTIKGLKHSSRYDIKVRILDYTNNQLEPSSSLYSNKLIVRTEFSEEDKDKEEAYEEYLKKYDQETEKLKHKPYWTGTDKKDEVIFKYRESYLQTEIDLESTYQLVTKEEVNEVTYYFPRKTFELARTEGITLQTNLDDYELYIRPGVLYKNQQVKDADKEIEDEKIEDYYISLQLRLEKAPSTINYEKTLLPVISIHMEIVYLDDKDLKVEEEIQDELLEEIAKGRKSIIDFLERELKDGKIDENYLDKKIMDKVKDVRVAHERDVEDILEDEIDDEEWIGDIQKSMLLIAKTVDNELQGYYRAGDRWQSVYTNMSLGGYSVTVEELGRYTMTGKKEEVLDQTSHIPGARDLINKYTLGDFFYISDYGMKEYITKEGLYGSVARILGAKRGTDYIQYLKNRGIQIEASYNPHQRVRQDEVIYVTMQAYEKMYYKDIQSIYITNKQSVQNIGAFQPKYRPYIYAAVELGVVKTEHQKILPSQSITVEAFLTILTRIMPK